MKKIYALGLGLLFLASCASDDGGSSVDESQLTKKWYYVSSVYSGITIPYDDHEACGKDYIEFVTGGIMRDVDVWDCEEDVYMGIWSLDGNKLTVGSDGESSVVTISKLNETTLQVKAKYDLDEDGDEETVVQNFTSIE